MLFTIIYLEARFARLRLRYVKTLVQMTCFIAAWVTMLSRVSDYHHRGSDVLAGSALGCLVALFITLVTGRVLFTYNRVVDHLEIDLKPM
jgi:membrane-associated phospholipid phosphatase